MGASIGMLAGLAALSSSPAQALGLPVFGDNKDPNEEYKENTVGSPQGLTAQAGCNRCTSLPCLVD